MYAKLVGVAHEKYQPLDWRKPVIQSLNHYQYWMPHSYHGVFLLIVDIDRDDALSHLYSILSHHQQLPWPTYIVQNATNGHAHVAWRIQPVATGRNARLAPQQYAFDTWRALTNAFGGDHAFNPFSGKTRNPYWHDEDNADVIWSGITEPYSLGTLAKGLQAEGLWNTRAPKEFRRDPVLVRSPDYGRNCHVFDVARLRKSGTVAQAAQQANDALVEPLHPVELATIVRSIERWERKTGRRGGRIITPDERKLQSARGKLGGSRNTEKQREARAQGPNAAAAVRSAEATTRHARITAMHAGGATRAQIMQQLGVSESTVKRALRAARNGSPDGSALEPQEGIAPADGPQAVAALHHLNTPHQPVTPACLDPVGSSPSALASHHPALSADPPPQPPLKTLNPWECPDEPSEPPAQY